MAKTLDCCIVGNKQPYTDIVFSRGMATALDCGIVGNTHSRVLTSCFQGEWNGGQGVGLGYCGEHTQPCADIVFSRGMEDVGLQYCGEQTQLCIDIVFSGMAKTWIAVL